MSTPERLDRKELKQPDQFQESVDQGATWIHDHLRTILLVAGGIVLAVALWAAYRAWDRGRELEAGGALAEALELVEAPIVEDAATAKPDDADDPTFADEAARTAALKARLEAVQERFGSADAAVVASVYLGRLAADGGDLATARTHWEKFLAKADGHLLVPSVRLSLLRLDREQGQAESALSYLEKATSPTAKSELPADLALHELAATYEALDRSEDARAAYQRLVDEHPDSPWVQPARQRLNVIGAPAAVAPAIVGS